VTSTAGDGDACRESDRLREVLVESTQPLDLVALALVPAALLGVFSLPEATRRSLAFAYADPTPLTAFTSHYVHLEREHLLANLVGYGLLAGIGYAVAAASRQRRLFFTAFVTFCVAFPVVLSALNLAVPRDAIGFGFSGINMAFAGLLPLLLAVFASRRLGSDASAYPVDLPVRLLPAAFLVTVGWMTTLALPLRADGSGVLGPLVMVLGIVVAVRQLVTLHHAPARPPASGLARAAIRRFRDRPGYGDLFAVGVVLVVGYPIIGFPTDPTTDGQVINLYVHLLGFCLAFIGPYVLIAVGKFGDPRTY